MSDIYTLTYIQVDSPHNAVHSRSIHKPDLLRLNSASQSTHCKISSSDNLQEDRHLHSEYLVAILITQIKLCMYACMLSLKIMTFIYPKPL